MSNIISAAAICRSLHAVVNGKEFSDGGEHRGLARRFFAEICRLCHITPPKDGLVALKKFGLNYARQEVFESILEISSDDLQSESGCELIVPFIDGDTNSRDFVRFNLQEHQGLLTITENGIGENPNVNATPKTTKGVTLTALKQAILQKYIDQEIHDKGSADLRSLDLTHLDLCKINFQHTKIDREQLERICASGGNLTGAIIDGISAKALNLATAKIDKEFALQMIRNGAPPPAVLVCYIESERFFGRTNIDLSGFDLSKTDLSALNLQGVNFDDITKCAGLSTAWLDPAVRVRFAKIPALVPTQSGRLNLAAFTDYIKIAKESGIKNIDIRGFHLIDIDLQYLKELGLTLSDVCIDKTGALALIDNEAKLRASEWRGQEGSYREVLVQYIASETLLETQNIDISGFDVSSIDLRELDLRRTNIVDQLESYLTDPAICNNLLSAKLPPAVRVCIEKTIALDSFAPAGDYAREVLTEYIVGAKKLGIEKIDIGGFDLNKIDLAGVDLRGTNLIEHLDNYLTDATKRENLSHAKLDPAVQARIDKENALDSIKKGGDFAKNIAQYLESARILGIEKIDISGFDIKTVLECETLDLRDTNITDILAPDSVGPVLQVQQAVASSAPVTNPANNFASAFLPPPPSTKSDSAPSQAESATVSQNGSEPPKVSAPTSGSSANNRISRLNRMLINVTPPHQTGSTVTKAQPDSSLGVASHLRLNRPTASLARRAEIDQCAEFIRDRPMQDAYKYFIGKMVDSNPELVLPSRGIWNDVDCVNSFVKTSGCPIDLKPQLTRFLNAPNVFSLKEPLQAYTA